MDNKKLRKLFGNKKFLKRNEFAELVSGLVKYCKENKKQVGIMVGVILVLGLTIPSVNWYKIKNTQNFNKDLYLAEKSIQKETKYKDLIKKYNGIPASQLVRLKLADDLLDHKNNEEAIKVLEEGLKNNKRNIFNTLIVLKQANIYKEQGNYEKAASIVANNQNKVIKSFVSSLKLLEGDLLVMANKKEQAKKVYEDIVKNETLLQSKSKNNLEYNEAAISTAKNKLLLLDLNVL